MRKLAVGVVVVILATGLVSGGPEINIDSIADLKEAIHSPCALEIVKKPEEWLPGLVASLRWKTLLSEHFVLHVYVDVSDEQDDPNLDLLMELEEIYGELEDFLRVEPLLKQEQLALKTRLNCFVIKTRSERTFGTLPDPHLLFYLLDPKEDPDYRVKLRHELAHWFWSRVYGEAPPLFNEGLAVYAEKLSAPNSPESELFAGVTFDSSELPPLTEIIDGDGFWKHKGMYTVGSLWIHFLVDRWGWKQLKEFFLSSDFEDRNFLGHFQTVYGERIELVESSWREYLRTKGILRESH